MLIEMKKLSHEEQNLELMSHANNYNSWIFREVKPFIGQRVLEIGGGVGSMTKFMLDRKLVVSTDISDYNMNTLCSLFKKRKNVLAIKTDISQNVELLKGFDFDTVVCLNVLEHIKDDLKAIKNMNSLLCKNGRIVLLLPAFSMLFGSIDKADHHFRRYNKKATLRKVRNAGFDVIKAYYMNFPGFFGWYYHSRILKARVHPKSSISFFDKLVPIFSFFEGIIRPPLGLSMIVIAKKKE